MISELEIDKLIEKSSKWLNGKGKDSDIIISSRIRLARNLKNIPFTNRAENEKLEFVIEIVKNAIMKPGFSDGMKYVKINNISELDRKFLVERHLISPFFEKLNNPRAILVDEDESSCIMINEEDHLRIQWIESGLEINKIWKNIKTIDDNLKSMLDYACSDELGYLTACPSNTGTGMRISFFCHIPGIVLSKKLDKVFSEIVLAGITVRGFYGEGSDVQGNIFQVSNQTTLGISEEDTIAKIKNVAERLIQYEGMYRNELLKSSKIEIEDKIYRAIAILKTAKIITPLEFMSLLSAVRLGAELKMIKKSSKKIMNELMVTLQPAHIQKIAKKELNPLEKDIIRAEIIKEKLKI